MCRILSTSVLLIVAAALGQAADPAKTSAKSATLAPPKELADPVRALFSDSAIQVVEGSKPVCDLWLRKQLPLKAGVDPKKGLGYDSIPESTVVGAVRFHQEWSSFRKQKIKPGVYTMRLAIQPMDGDHMGTAPHNEFLLLAPAAADQKPAALDAKSMHQLSSKCLPGTSHPAVLLLFPNPKPEDEPKMAEKPNQIWVLNCKETVTGNGVLGLGLTLFGASELE